MTRRALPLLGLGAALALTLGACSDDFDPYNRLNSLRVLAIQSEPVAPGPGETTTLTPLVYLPDGLSLTSVKWSWCPFVGSADQGYPCLVTEEQLRAQLGVAVPSFDLGTGATAQLPNSIDPAVLRQICEPAPGTPMLPGQPRCEGGYPVQVRMTVNSSDGDEVIAVRTVRLRYDASQPANANPRIEGLFVERTDPAPDEPLDLAQLAGRQPPILARDQDSNLRAVVSADNAEIYPSRDNMDKPIIATERLILTWFVESGDTRNERTSTESAKDSPEFANDLFEALGNKWKPARRKDYAASTSRIVVVLRDDREGVSWISGLATLEPGP